MVSVCAKWYVVKGPAHTPGIIAREKKLAHTADGFSMCTTKHLLRLILIEASSYYTACVYIYIYRVVYVSMEGIQSDLGEI